MEMLPSWRKSEMTPPGSGQVDVAGGSLVRVICVGQSRGAIAAMYLAQMLGEVPENEVELFALLFDPVPGNLLITARLDIA